MLLCIQNFMITTHLIVYIQKNIHNAYWLFTACSHNGHPESPLPPYNSPLSTPNMQLLRELTSQGEFSSTWISSKQTIPHCSELLHHKAPIKSTTWWALHQSAVIPTLAILAWCRCSWRCRRRCQTIRSLPFFSNLSIFEFKLFWRRYVISYCHLFLYQC